MGFTVYVDDNGHYRDESERRVLGEYESLDAARAEAMKLVDRFLARAHHQHETADSLFRAYTMYGEDPFIVPDSASERFSAYRYARAQCERLFPG